MSTATHTARRHPLRTAAMLVGITFIAVGVLGFIPGITQQYSELGWVGHDGAQLLGIFGVNILHNIAHLGLGIAGVLAAAATATSLLYLIGGGLLYGGLWLYGLVIDLETGWNFLALNTADNWLHFGLAATMVTLGLVLRRQAREHVEDVDRIGPARAPDEVGADGRRRSRERLTR